ncbi:hypothetical protein EDD15DRAFT_2163109, partial [Pisolithus albus]
SYEKNIKLNGMLYFHPIPDHVIGERMSRNYHIFKELCGKDNCKNVIFYPHAPPLPKTIHPHSHPPLPIA